MISIGNKMEIEVISAVDGHLIEDDEIVQDFRGKDWKFIGLVERNSKIYVRDIDNPTNKRIFFPAVCKLIIREKEDGN